MKLTQTFPFPHGVYVLFQKKGYDMSRLSDSFRPLTGFMFFSPVCITLHISLLRMLFCGAEYFLLSDGIRNNFKNCRIPHIYYNGADYFHRENYVFIISYSWMRCNIKKTKYSTLDTAFISCRIEYTECHNSPFTGHQ